MSGSEGYQISLTHSRSKDILLVQITWSAESIVVDHRTDISVFKPMD